MANDLHRLVLKLIQELLGTRESDLVDVLLHLVLGHPHPGIRHGDGLLLLIHAHADGQIAQLLLALAGTHQRFELLGGINGIRHQLA